MSGLIESRFNIFTPLLHGRTLAYNSMSGATAVWEADDSSVFQRIRKGEYFDPEDVRVQQLLYGGFITREDCDEIGILKQQYEELRSDPTGMILTIAPTMSCNFGCDYCFQGCDKPSGSMSADVQDEIVGLVSRSLPYLKRLNVAWYGGEPLLAFPIVEALSDRIIRLCQEHSVRYEAMIVTNGFKLTSEIARSLHQRRVNVIQITLDGAEEFHDKRRGLLGGQPTFKRIVNNLKTLLEQVSIRVSIRVNIDSRNSSSIFSLIDCLKAEGFAETKKVGVYFAPVEAITEGCHAVADDCMSKTAYADLETALFKYAYAAGLAALPYPSRFRGLCGALRPKGLVVLPNGDIHKCWNTVSNPNDRVGTVFEMGLLNGDERALRWTRWTPFENKTCKSCKLLPNCAGSCAHKFINSDQTLGEAATLPCPSWKFSIKERLIFMAEKTGTISRDDYDPREIGTVPSEICAESLQDAQSKLGVVPNGSRSQRSSAKLKILSNVSL